MGRKKKEQQQQQPHGSSTSKFRDKKYREKLKNSVNLLESVLPLSKKVRSRKKMYEDALDLTSVLEESLFHLVNRLRVQNQENIYNFAVLTPSYMQASFMHLIKQMEEDVKNGTQMNAQLVEKMSFVASDFFTGLMSRCSKDRMVGSEVCDLH